MFITSAKINFEISSYFAHKWVRWVCGYGGSRQTCFEKTGETAPRASIPLVFFTQRGSVRHIAVQNFRAIENYGDAHSSVECKHAAVKLQSGFKYRHQLTPIALVFPPKNRHRLGAHVVSEFS